MNTRSNSDLAIIITLFIFLAVACNSVTPFLQSTPAPLPPTLTATSIPDILRFENDVIAFDYPAGARIFASGDPAFVTYPEDILLGGELVVGLADPKWTKSGYLFSSIGVFRYPIPTGSTLDEIMKEAYKNIRVGDEISDESGPVIIAGTTAHRKSYRVAAGPLWYTLCDIWIEKEGNVIRVSTWEEVYAPNFQLIADLFINKLIIKDNLPPVVIKPTPTATLVPTPFSASSILHYENDVVAFDYLTGMMVFEAGDLTFQCYPDFQLGGDIVVGLGDPKFTGFGNYYRSIRISRQPMPPNSNLETIMLEAYRQIEAKSPRDKGVMNTTGPITVAGQSALQWTYRIYSGEPAYELRDIWLPKDGELFIISIWTEYTNPNDFAAFQASADILVESLRIK